jgi:chromosome segregation ATPase
MSDQPLTFAVLARFHREVILPDVERIVGALFEQRINPRLDAIDAHFDAIYQRFDRLETEYQAIKAGLDRVEERLDRVEERLDRVEKRLGVLEAEHRDLVAAVLRLDERLSRVEKRLEELVDAQREYALRSEVQELRARLDGLQAQVNAIEKRPQR